MINIKEKFVNKKYIKFLKEGGSLLVVKDNEIIFESKDNYLEPLIECVGKYKDLMAGAWAYDKLLGNAAALLFVYAKVKGVYSLTGSKAGIETLKKHDIDCVVEKTIDCVLNDQGNDLCPMERLVSGKSPQEFYQQVLR